MAGEGDNSVHRSGAAYIFVREGGGWTQQAYLKASNPNAIDRFGNSIGLSGDTVVVGAFGEDSLSTGVNDSQTNDVTNGNTGAAYVFTRQGTTWTQEAYLKASNTDRADQFGYSVAIQGSTILVGANTEDSAATGVNGDQTSNAVSGAGSAYLFHRNSGNWEQVGYLKASNTGTFDSGGDQFGY